MQTLFTFYNSMRRSTELSLPLQLVFPGCAAQEAKASTATATATPAGVFTNAFFANVNEL
jgi:hypothetical protein